LARKKKEGKRKGGEGKCGEEKGTDTGGVFQRLLSPNELQSVEEKLTESVPQPCSILSTAIHNFIISMPECFRYPPKCTFSRVNNEKFSGEVAVLLRPLHRRGGGNPLPVLHPLGATPAPRFDLAHQSSE